VQMFIQTGKILYRPCARPGERVAPLPPRLERTLVDNDFLRISGTQAHLEADGWRTSWCRESRLPTLERQGWELVVVSGAGGVPTSLYRSGIPEAQVYIKSRGRDLQMLANHPYFRQSAGIRGYSVDDAAHTISFHFDGPANAGAFIHRTNRHPNGLRCKWGAGRVDVVVVDVPRESTP